MPMGPYETARTILEQRRLVPAGLARSYAKAMPKQTVTRSTGLNLGVFPKWALRLIRMELHVVTTPLLPRRLLVKLPDWST